MSQGDPSIALGITRTRPNRLVPNNFGSHTGIQGANRMRQWRLGVRSGTHPAARLVGMPIMQCV